MELIEILQEYRNGNKDIFNVLYSDEITKDGLAYGRSNLKINDEGLEHCILGWYETYRLPYKLPKGNKCTKFSEQVYNGSKEDLKLDVLTELFKLFEDTSFCPKTNSEIYSRLKYETVKVIGENIDTSALGISDIRYDDEGEEYSVFETEMTDNYLDFQVDRNDGYCQAISEVQEALPYIKSLLRNGAESQQKVIDLICKYYDFNYYDSKKDTYSLPKQQNMLRLYRKEYGKSISQARYSKILNRIFDVMADCTISLKGKNVKRNKFKKGNYNEI